MNKDKKKLSRGKVLHKIAKQSNLSIKDLADKAGYKYPTFYIHIKRDDLPFETLARYGKALNHDFSNEFPEMADIILSEPGSKYSEKMGYDALMADRDKWKEKYITLSDKYNAVVERYQKILEEKLGINEDE
ncbi:hypothetical protein GS399_03095 [Pedobacter sp. HMF7647]|uniref:Helix-turn-helix domain-containing protein n=1 Tax=Hufsiella arboris TaxID=2695275 RepID=A0A7K1Y5T2_9SPHI|nr:helix-turn-helix domain-containing protein [Hufsiella arboris]MXV49944.1 hypothetical protein [Hufsiella arboris]